MHESNSNSATPKSTKPSQNGSNTGPETVRLSQTIPTKQTGISVSETGSSLSLRTSSLDALMAGTNPFETRKFLEASMKDLLGTTPVADTEVTYPKGEFKSTLLRYQPLPQSVTAPQLSQALTLVKQSLKPMSEVEIAALVTRVRAITIVRKEAMDDTVKQIATYAALLAEYPADAVRHVLTTWHQRDKFFPTMYDLLEYIEPWIPVRKKLFDLLTDELQKRE